MSVSDNSRIEAVHAGHTFASGQRVHDLGTGQDGTVSGSFIRHELQPVRPAAQAGAAPSAFNFPDATEVETVVVMLDGGDQVDRLADDLIEIPKGLRHLPDDFAPPAPGGVA